MDKQDWPDDQEQRGEIKALWEEPWGDRRQEIVVIGQDMDPKAVTAKFDMCLLTDEEMALGPERWKSDFNDPFYEWREVTEEEFEAESDETLIRE